MSQLTVRILDLGARWLGGWGSVQAEGLVFPLKPGASLMQPALQDEVGRHLMRSLPKPFPVNPKVARGRWNDLKG